MVIGRILVLAMLLAGVACFVAYVFTGERRWRSYGVRFVGITVVAGLAFFAVMIAMRLSDSA